MTGGRPGPTLGRLPARQRTMHTDLDDLEARLRGEDLPGDVTATERVSAVRLHNAELDVSVGAYPGSGGPEVWAHPGDPVFVYSDEALERRLAGLRWIRDTARVVRRWLDDGGALP